ncbi:hypothetical protein B0H14DRAFT_1394495 [Mycena olivaceomarginata]|nr:hypothetical protein B0H14DRAFT_1394495 [Mycena olivaceomarginata]
MAQATTCKCERCCMLTPCHSAYPDAAIYINLLPQNIQPAELQDCFEKMGQITEIQSFGHGHAIVKFTDLSAATDSVAKYHTGCFAGRPISVQLLYRGYSSRDHDHLHDSTATKESPPEGILTGANAVPLGNLQRPTLQNMPYHSKKRSKLDVHAMPLIKQRREEQNPDPRHYPTAAHDGRKD